MNRPSSLGYLLTPWSCWSVVYLDLKLCFLDFLKMNLCLHRCLPGYLILLLGLSPRLPIILSGLFSMNCNSPEEKYGFIMNYFPCKGLVKEKLGSNSLLFNHFGIPSESSGCTYFQHSVMLGHSGHSTANVCHVL